MLQIAPPRTEAPVQGIEIPTSAAGMGGIREVVAFIRRAQRIVALFGGVALSLGLAYLLFATPQFTATSVVLVDANKAPGFQQRPLSSDPISDAANIESQIEVVRSDGVALAVISRLKLADDPSFLPKPSLPSQVWNWMTSRFISQAPQTDLDPKVYGALELYRKSLTVRRLNLSFALEVSFTALSPSKAAQIANAIADVFIEQGLQEKVRTAQSAGDWLNKRLAELEQNALSAERAVQEFKTQHGMVDTGRSGDGNAQFIDQKRVEELSTQLTAARAQTADAEAKLRRIEEVTGAASSAYRNDLLLAKSREEELSKRLNEAIRAFEVADRDRASLRSLEAVARGARTIYDNFVQRYSETLQQNFPVIEARVISPALPPLKKSSPKTLIVLGGALVAGVLLGLTTAFVRDSLDRGFRTPAQVEAILGANCLGLLPMTESGEAPLQLKLSAKHGGERRAETCPRAMRKVLEDPFSRFSETVRGVKVAMDLLNLTRPAQLVGVTSSIPGEGKSTFSANLAALAAQTGASTLLIDLDLRNPSLTRSLARPATEGVLEVWAGALSLPDAVLVDEASGMHVLPAVVRSPIAHTHEILGSDRMRDIIRKARETYELIVVDLSPLEPVVDVRAIGGLLDSAVFVVEWGRTPQEIVSEAVNHSGLTSEQVLGFVLNKVDMDAYRRFADVPQDYYYYGDIYYGTSDMETFITEHRKPRGNQRRD